MGPFNAISKKPNQILVAHMPNSFNFNSKFFLCLTPKENKFRS